jgi:hypothetical protein
MRQHDRSLAKMTVGDVYHLALHINVAEIQEATLPVNYCDSCLDLSHFFHPYLVLHLQGYLITQQPVERTLC